MSAKLVHILVTAAAALTGVGTAIYANVAKLPERWQQPVMAGVGVAGVVGAGVMAAAVAITEQKNPNPVPQFPVEARVPNGVNPLDEDVAKEIG